MVIGSRPGAELVSVAPLTVDPEKEAVPKSASGSTPPLLDGASAMTSADVSRALLSRAEVVWLQPRLVSRIVSVKDPVPLVVTDAVM